MLLAFDHANQLLLYLIRDFVEDARVLWLVSNFSDHGCIGKVVDTWYKLTNWF